MTLKSVLSLKYVRTWMILVVLAVVMPIVSIASHSGTAAAIVVLGLAAFKARLVGLDFMEVRNSPKELRWTFEAYCFGLWVILAGCFLWM